MFDAPTNRIHHQSNFSIKTSAVKTSAVKTSAVKTSAVKTSAIKTSAIKTSKPIKNPDARILVQIQFSKM